MTLQEKDSCSPFFTQVYKVYFRMKQERVNSKVFAPERPRNADVSKVLVFSARINKTTKVLEFDTLEKIPNPFLGIQFGRISRQTFNANPLGSPFCQEIFDGLTAVNGCSVPDHQDQAADLAQEKL